MEHYVTLFDSLFLPQGLALHASMMRRVGEFTLWILCVDDRAYSVLSRMQLAHVRLLALPGVETPALAKVKPTRTRAEYCWTLTPFTPQFVFDADPTVTRVTYLDADTWFCGHPRAVFEEFERSQKSVLITGHAYAAEYDHSQTAGRFCVQFMSFVRGAGEGVRSWWADRCIEWCFAREEDGKFGDQRYLDDWPERFAREVHVLRDRSALQAPWNATRFPHGEAVVFHFHGLRLLRRGQVLMSEGYPLPAATVDAVYRPYIADLKAAIAMLADQGLTAAPQLDQSVLVVRMRIRARRLLNAWRRAMAPRVLRL